MAKLPIKNIIARQILDSRGIPTLEVIAETPKGIGLFGVPSGASIGNYEALELRDGGTSFFGLGVSKAITNVNEVLARKIRGMDVFAQAKIDAALIDLDGTDNKSRLGANAILGVSGAVCKAAAASKKVPMFRYIAALHKNKKFKLPQPSFLAVEGGAHGDTNLDIQEWMLVPDKPSFQEKLEAAAEVFQVLRKVLKLHRLDTDIGNEGGYAPNWESNHQAFSLIMDAVNQTSHRGQIQLAIDAAASEFYSQKEGQYILRADHTSLTAERMVSLYNQWIDHYPVISIEDGLAQDDWDEWKRMHNRLGNKVVLVADDLTVTQKKRLEKAVSLNVANAVIIKPNQVGTITETLQTVKFAQANKYKIFASHRAGETNDDFIADFAVGIGADFIKAGSVARGERVAKWNRLLAIEEELK